MNVDDNPMKSENPAPLHGFVDRLAEKIGITASASRIFGDPIEREGVTIVPVAKARWGFGGGGGGSDTEGGSGGGGGVQISPLGYIEIKNGDSRYVPIKDPAVWTAIILAGTYGSSMILRRVVRLLRSRE